MALTIALCNFTAQVAYVLREIKWIIIFNDMADENIFDKAENLARRVFERLGTKVDAKLASDKESIFSHREVSDLIAKLERAIDANLKADSKGTKRVAPHCFKVLITYERTPHLNI